MGGAALSQPAGAASVGGTGRDGSRRGQPHLAGREACQASPQRRVSEDICTDAEALPLASPAQVLPPNALEISCARRRRPSVFIPLLGPDRHSISTDFSSIVIADDRFFRSMSRPKSQARCGLAAAERWKPWTGMFCVNGGPRCASRGTAAESQASQRGLRWQFLRLEHLPCCKDDAQDLDGDCGECGNQEPAPTVGTDLGKGVDREGKRDRQENRST
jgi:hypothetical protein